jgi:hypothetical protein
MTTVGSLRRERATLDCRPHAKVASISRLVAVRPEEYLAYYSGPCEADLDWPLTRAAAKYGENVPVATACCNACRTCVPTNVVTVALAAAAVVGARIAQLVAGERLALRQTPSR